MQPWLIGVVVTSVVLMTVLFVLSFDSLEYQEYGLNCNYLSESVEKEPYSAGRYYLGITNRFLKFPRTVKSIAFINDWNEGQQGPALMSRTRDGLTVQLEVSFQYQLKFDELYDMWSILGLDYEKTFVRMAIEQLTTATTNHNAHFFFRNRTFVSMEMHKVLDDHFQKHGFAEVPFFQLRTVHLPNEFEDAIRETQVQEQHIAIARLEQLTKKVSYGTEVLKAKQAVQKLHNEAAGEAQAIATKNSAYCQQYKLTQQLQAEALKNVAASTTWETGELLDYLSIRRSGFAAAEELRGRAKLSETMQGLTLEGWCEEALWRWKMALGPDGQVKEHSRPSSVLSLLLLFVLLCAAAAALVDYPFQEVMQDWWPTPEPPIETDAESAPRSGMLMLVLCIITTVQLVALVLVVNCCGGGGRYNVNAVPKGRRGFLVVARPAFALNSMGLLCGSLRRDCHIFDLFLSYALPLMPVSRPLSLHIGQCDRSMKLEAAWSSTRQERVARLQRELLFLGEETPLERIQLKAPRSWRQVEPFLEPQSPEDRGLAMLPGRARSLAGRLVEELQRGRQAAASELRNWDRSAEERQQLATGAVPLSVLVDGLEPQEVGCLLRTCEAAGVQELVLCGETAGPPDKKVLKTSLKAEEFLPHRRGSALDQELQKLRQAGVQTWILDLEQAPARLTTIGSVGCSPAVIGSVVIYKLAW
ncbi:unnamed protein product, partial [Effrenium voratum]